MSEGVPSSLGCAIRAALLTADPHAKVMAARKVARDWRLGRLAWRFETDMPEEPARPRAPELLSPSQMPRRRGEQGRIALWHALAHIEFVAIDLALDIVGRFGGERPRGFTDDFLSVAADEAMHFALLDRKLASLGSYYGALPAHGGLWQAARDTSDDVAARLAIVPMVLEARGLDVTPATIARARNAGDEHGARILQRILTDEIRHVACGTTSFERVARERGETPEKLWQFYVETRFAGKIKAPLNDSARLSAGLSRSYYAPLVS